MKRCFSKLLLAAAFCAAGFSQTLFTTPGNGVSLRARMFYSDGRPCVSCSLSWSTVTGTTQGAAQGSHYHSPSSMPQGTLSNAATATDSNGYATALWTSRLNSIQGWPTGYAGGYAVQVCSPVAQNVCVVANISAWYSLTPASSSSWIKTGDSSHQSAQYNSTSFFASKLATISLKFKGASGFTPMIVRLALPKGGIYDGWLSSNYWQTTYMGPIVAEDHMYGDEADFSVSGWSTAQLQDLYNAINSTVGYDGVHPCELFAGPYLMAHVYCGETPGGVNGE